MKRMDKSEFLFKILSYTFTTIFAAFCLYPFIYAISATLSSKNAMDSGLVILYPVEVQLDAFKAVLEDKMFGYLMLIPYLLLFMEPFGLCL